MDRLLNGARLIRLVFLLVVLVLGSSTLAAVSNSKISNNVEEFTPEVKKILNEKGKLLLRELQNKALTQALETANRSGKVLTLDQIKVLDKDWQERKLDKMLVTKLLKSRCSKFLRSFQHKNPGYAEIFVTDRAGLNLCLTNKTSDYYQSDEKWWQQAVKAEPGKIVFGSIEYDESSQSVAIPICFAIYDKEGGLIGVSKAIIDLETIKSKL